MQKRNTIQKALVMDAVRELKCHATAEEVYNHIRKTHDSIGKATVYRNLNELSEEGLIRKIEVPGGADRYDHMVEKHNHIICKVCGRAFDVDMEETNDLISLIRNTHGFEFLDYQVLFRGICPECKKEKEEKNNG